MINSPPLLTSNFILRKIEADIADKRCDLVVTRFPPEPNGFLHIGHVKAICLNFGIALHFGGHCHLRMDDTNPAKENQRYIQAIIQDIHWLQFEWYREVRYASDYFDKLYTLAQQLIQKGLAYVDSLNDVQIREYRGTLTSPGIPSPDRNRLIDENLDLFARMKNGEYDTGRYVLRAKIDMSSSNLNMRDPVIYRILKDVRHPRTGKEWCIYPLYDYAHSISDAIEGITHSLCTLEFEDHRPLYDWFVRMLDFPHPPQQIEFARLSLTRTITSKRNLQRIVEDQLVTGWDDPRMPTIAGMRNRGYTPSALRNFCTQIGVTKTNATIDFAQLENTVRTELNNNAERAFVILRPLKIVITNYTDGMDFPKILAPNHPQRPELGSRELYFGPVIYIEQDDFSENPPKGFRRLILGKEVRLRYGCVIRCDHIVRDSVTQQITELHCQYDQESWNGKTSDGRKVKGIIHWLSEQDAVETEVRFYEQLFLSSSDIKEKNNINPSSVEVIPTALMERSLTERLKRIQHLQFERVGYFYGEHTTDKAHPVVWNRVVSLREGYSPQKST